MPSLKEDTAAAVNLLANDPKLCEIMELDTRTKKASQILATRQHPGEAKNVPIINVYVQSQGNVGGNVTLNQLVVDVYTPLTTQRQSGVSFDITRRIKEVLDRKPIGRGLRWQTTDPDRRSNTGWHKATVRFTFLSAQY